MKTFEFVTGVGPWSDLTAPPVIDFLKENGRHFSVTRRYERAIVYKVLLSDEDMTVLCLKFGMTVNTGSRPKKYAQSA